MITINLVDNEGVLKRMLPLTFTRPVSELLCGALTIREWWEKLIPCRCGYRTNEMLSGLFASAEDAGLEISSEVIPSEELALAIMGLKWGESLFKEGLQIARRGGDSVVEYNGTVERLEHVWDLFAGCGRWMTSQFPLLSGKSEGVFIHPDAKVYTANLNSENGPIYIGAGAEVMEGACLRGPIAVLAGAHVNMGARIYGATVIGENCRVGGELNNVVMHACSNKAHDGFLGNAVIGSWCNLGAGCTASNLKNDYTEVRVWDYETERFARTGLLFCGLISGDHTKAGINTMFNTGTVLGVGVNVHGSGYPRTFVPNFKEGSANGGFSEVNMVKFLATARRVMARRGVELTAGMEELLLRLRAGS